MNWDNIKKDWNEKCCEDAQQRFNKVPQDEMKATEGDADKMCECVSKAYGTDKEESRRQIDDWANNVRAEATAGTGQHGQQSDQSRQSPPPRD